MEWTCLMNLGHYEKQLASLGARFKLKNASIFTLLLRSWWVLFALCGSSRDKIWNFSSSSSSELISLESIPVSFVRGASVLYPMTQVHPAISPLKSMYWMLLKFCIYLLNILQPANPNPRSRPICKCSINNSPKPTPWPIQFNGKTFGIWLSHLVHCISVSKPIQFQIFKHAYPNFFGSVRLLSATNNVLSYATSACFNWFFECSSTNFW